MSNKKKIIFFPVTYIFAVPDSEEAGEGKVKKLKKMVISLLTHTRNKLVENAKN